MHRYFMITIIIINFVISSIIFPINNNTIVENDVFRNKVLSELRTGRWKSANNAVRQVQWTDTNGRWAVAFIQNMDTKTGIPFEEESKIILGEQNGNEWTIYFPGDENYNFIVTQIPPFLLPKSFFPQSKSMVSVQAARNAGKLPWTYNQIRQVTQDRQNTSQGASHTPGSSDEWAWDFGLSTDEAVLASRSGIIAHIYTSTPKNTGCSTCDWTTANRIVVDHEDGTATLYMHLSNKAPPVSVLQRVSAGQIIGYADHTGRSGGTHLHFALQPWNSNWNGAVTGTLWYQHSLESLFDDPNVSGGNPTFPNSYKSGNSGTTPPPACSPNADQVALYVDPNHGGQCIVKGVGDYTNPSAIGLPNDAISSIKVGGNVKLKLCRDDNYTGTCENFQGDDGNLADNAIGDNQASSAKVESRGCSWNADQIALYVDSNYGGQCVVKSVGDYSNPGSIGLPNDAISSVRVGSNVKVRLCRDDNFTSTCEDFQGDDSNLGDNSVGDNQASSAKVEVRGCSTNADQVTLYTNTGYGGQCVTLGVGDYSDPGNLAPVGNDNTRSIRVGSNVQATLYSDAGFAGTPETFTGDDSDLTNNSINSQTSSVKIRSRTQPASAPTLQSPSDGAAFNEGQAITLAWSATGNEYYGEITGGPNPLTFGWQTGTSKDIGSQWAGYTYSWHVKARNSAGESGYSGTRTFTVKPGAPTNLSAQVASCSQINLSWGDNSGSEDGYKIYRDTMLIGQVGADATSYQNTGLSGSTGYTYMVKAFKGSIESNASNDATISTSACPAQVAAGFDAWPQSGEAPLTVAMHNISSGDFTACAWDYGDGTTGTSCADYHDHIYDQPGAYTVRLTVSGAGGTDSQTLADYINVSPPPCIDAFEPDDTAAQAHDFTVGSTEDHALCAADDQDWVSFSAVAGVRYQIETLDLSPGTDTILDLYQSDGSTLIISDDDGNGNFASLIAGQFAVSGVYYVKTRAYQGVGAPAHTYSLRITAQCSDSYEPDNSAAQSHQFAVGTTEPHAFCEQNDQDWVTIAATAGTTYRIETLNLAPGADTVLDLYQSDGSTLITSDDDGNGQLGSLITWQAPAAGTYYVKARDYSASGDATRRYDLRITASQPPAAPALQSPANAAAFNEGQSITLAWSATGAEYYGEVANGIGGTIALGWQAGTSSNIGSQQPGYTYSWRVKARSNSAESLWSATRTFVVRPAAPTNLSAQAASCSQINLAWADNSAFEEGYSIYQNGVRIAQVAANATSYQPSSLSESTSYSYIVKAYKGTVESNASNTVSAATSACLVAPAAAFDAWPQIGDAPLTVAMHNISTGNYTNCSWNYGDGATGTSCAGYHDHVYTAPGRYTVQLTVSGPAGTSTYSRPDYIIVSGAAPAQNLLANPGFELDTNNDGRPDSWSSSSKFTRSTTFKHGGAAAGKHAATDNSGSTISLQVNNLQAGKTYRFGGWIYVPATTDSFTYKTEIRWRNSSGSTLRTDVVYTMPSNVTKGVWLEAPAQASLVAPVNTANAQVRMVLGSLNAAIYVDDFTLQEVVSSDATPPQVTGKTPSANATSVALGTNVTATFNEVVTGVSGASFTLTPQGGTAVLAASVSYDTTSRTATLNPTSDLAASTTYIVNLTSSIKDSANNALVPVTWSFTTAPGNSDTTPPQVTGKTPSASATSVALGTNVTATFNEVVTGVSGASFTLTPQGGTAALAASVSYDTTSRTATLNPTSDLAASTTYIVNLTSSIKDSANNALVPVTWSFTTAPPSSGGATFTFASDADTYVSQASATTNYATATSFSIVGGTTTEKQAFIRFVVSGLPSGAAIQSAKLRLYVTNDSSAGGVFTRISNNTWAETISWNTKPALDGVQVASLGAVPANTFIEVDLTSGISGNGTYSFAITLPNSNTNTLGYATKEASTAANRPQLIITT